jgi:Domain of unknown function (DUF4337)
VSESMERAHETIHEVHHAPTEPWARGVAVMVSALAAALALAEIGEKASQNAYLTHHIAVSDDWAFYQAKYLRAVVKESETEILRSLPTDPQIADRITRAEVDAARMRDDPKGGEGMKQLAEKAREQEEIRNEAFHRYHNYEFTVGALEIAIVLASVSVVTRIRALTLGAGAIGVAACAFGVAVAAYLF